jgi:hypothetical protein
MLRKVISKLVAVVVLVTVIMSGNTAYGSTTYDVPSNSSFKSYMDYEKITNKSSEQWKLQQLCTTTGNGFRTYNGYYTVAVGTGYNAPVGTYLDATLDTGIVLHCIVGDVKSNNDTDGTNKQDKNNNSVLEFIVDQSLIKVSTNKSGTVSTIDGFEGDVVSICVYSNSDTASIDWLRSVDDMESTNSYLVTDKYSVDVGDITLYIVEFAAPTDFNTIEVNKDTYNSLVVNSSVISLD